ncbi:DNA-methyltransferase [Natronococcus jeotgali]|uniref:Type II methyltransferase n=1 Tax=Natronococcus jeotgali DSM 18795 TaxID=1227498 RepID=L9XL72_9EURY|nr:site-specific DNA-methyltransferase [Natronococcus jeotgali]ELY62514.1 DNA methylase N-4/N-6 domain-containing protein [Natronococcus jeotgali DSM 18795]
MTDSKPAVANLLKSPPAYTSSNGAAYLGDSRDLLEELPPNAIDLVITSPPFDLAQQKEYGSDWESDYIEWFTEFADKVRPALTPHGSFVIEIGGAFHKGAPSRSTYQFELLSKLVNDHEFELAQDFYWHNPAKLPSPAEWVTRRRIRSSDAVTHIWWLAKEINDESAKGPDANPTPEADNSRVLTEYSESQKDLIRTGEYNAGKRPSGHNISESAFATDNEGAIPDNLISATNTGSKGHYHKMCKQYELKKHPARFPKEIPEFFIKFLTPDPPYNSWDRGHLDQPIILDIFGGSNITGKIAEENDRYWITFEKNEQYLDTSEVRFMSEGEVMRKYDDGQTGLEDFPN